MRYWLSLVLGVLILAGCESNTEPEDTLLQVDEQLTEQAAVGAEINELAISAKDIIAMTSGESAMDTGVDVPLNGMVAMKEHLNRIGQTASDAAKSVSVLDGLAKITADSLILIGEKQFPNYIKRWALYYDPETGYARYYEVKEGTMIFKLIYDSSEVKIDLNKTLDVSVDDKILSLYQLQLFDENFFISKIERNIEATDYEGTCVTGFIASEESWYKGIGKLMHKYAAIEINPDGSGTIHEILDFSDGTSATSTITFKNDNTGTFTRTLRNGINISGSFNRVEDDLHGYYDETIDFPDGHYLDKIRKFAEVTITLPDSILDGIFRQIVRFSSGEVDSAQIDIQITVNDGVKTTVLEIIKHNGAHGTITIAESDAGKEMEGDWTTWDGHYIIFNGAYLLDGSATLHYEVYISKDAFDNGDDPVLVADYYFYPDKTGDGEIAYEGQTYQVEFNDSGQGFLKRGGKQLAFRMFQHIKN